MTLSNARIRLLLSFVAIAATHCADVATSMTMQPTVPARMDTGGTGCTETLGDESPRLLCVQRVSGRVTDLAGQPIAGATLTLCGAGRCIDVQVSATGTFDHALNGRMDPAVFAVHGEVLAQPYAIVYATLPNVQRGIARYEEPIRLPSLSTAGTPIVSGVSSGTTLTAGDVSLTVAAGTRLTPSFADEGRMLSFRALGVARYQGPAFAQTTPLDALYALGPAALTSSTPMRLSIRNRAELPANTRVEFITMGHELESDRFDAGFAKVLGTGRVTADGQRIESDTGVGLRELYWVGIRRR
ncbi:MAG: hypothetical protein Q8Q09_19550 [Deltaproteobacteria bacterium]|nr:hypothetical protein [Deltaproteobacteria bacterium]